mgnify:CR=1 FL=1
MVRFRRSTSFCDACGWVVLTTDWNEWTAVQTSFLPSTPSLLHVSYKRLYKAFSPKQPNNQNKKQSIFLKTLLSSGVVKSDCELSPPLKYPWSIFIWRRGRSWKLASFHWQYLQKFVLFLSSFWGEWTCSIGFRNASRILASTNLKKLANGMLVRSRDLTSKQKTEHLFHTIRQPKSLLKNQSLFW